VSSAPLDATPGHVDVDFAWELFSRFVACDTSARIGENRIDPRDERLTTFAHEVAAPALSALGARLEIDELNNVVARFGEDTGAELLFVCYPALHHGNEMQDPLRARREKTDGDELWIGLGASQGKAGLAAVCAAVRLLQAERIDLAGRVSIAVSSEGSSSHRSAESLFRAFSPLPAGAILTVGTENRISLGNRGRVDVVVEIPGTPTHSSAPELGESPIPVVAAVLERLARVDLDTRAHGPLGRRTLVPYKLVCGPVAPHTIPAWCELVLDRRLLPGDDPDAAVDDVANALDGLATSVSKGPFMLPALVEETDRVVVALQAGARAALGRQLEVFYPPYTFDAGYGCSIGVPAVMCGPSSGELAGTGVLGEDAVSLARVREAAAFYAGAIAC
jgi:succinyl-diaminopimelate desuccinylase